VSFVSAYRPQFDPWCTELHWDRFHSEYFCLPLSVWFHQFFPLWRNSPTRTMAALLLRFLAHTQWHTTIGRTPLDEGSTRRKDLYLTSHNTHQTQTSMPRRDSKPQSQQASGLRPSPNTYRPLMIPPPPHTHLQSYSQQNANGWPLGTFQRK
jgi:hypothetical protein